MKTYKVYRHTSPSGKCYIGITCQRPTQRWGTKGKNYHDCPVFWNAIQKYGWDNFKHEILFENLTRRNACKKEIELIALYQSQKLSYNTNTGGEGSRGHKVSEETKQKLRNFRLGKPGIVLSEYSRHLISLTKLGNKNPNWGKPSPQRKSVYAYSPQGKLIYEYSNLTEAAKQNNIPVAWFCTLKMSTKLRNGLVWSLGLFAPPITRKKSTSKKYTKSRPGHKITTHIHKHTLDKKSKIKPTRPIFEQHPIPYSKSKDPKAIIVYVFDMHGKYIEYYCSGRQARLKCGISLGCLTMHKNKPHFLYKGAWYLVIG